MVEPKWLRYAQQLQAISQNGLTFAQDPFDRERYEAVRAIAVEIMAENAGLDAKVVEALFEADKGYATPKVEVRGAVFQEGRVLLVQERTDNRWSLPGGWADVQDSPSEAIRKEIEQESGLLTKVTKLAAVFDRARHPHTSSMANHVYKLFFIAEPIGGALRPSVETSDAAFFSPNELPTLSTGRVLATQIHRMFEHRERMDLPTDFD